MRGRRARAAVVERLGEVSADVAEAMNQVGDDSLEWVDIAGQLLSRTPVSRSACVAVVALMRFGLAEISPRHPQRLLFVQHYSAGMGLLADLHGEVEALDEMGDLLKAEVQGRADDDPILLYAHHARVLIAKTRKRLVPGEATTREFIEAGLAQLRTMRLGDEDAVELMARLGNAYHDLFHLTAAPTTLADSLRFTGKALDGVSGNDPRRGRVLRSAVAVLRHRYEDLGEDSVLAEMVRLGRDIVRWHAVLGQSDQNAADALGDVGALLRKRYQEFGDPDTLDEAIYFVRAAAASAADDSDKLFHLADLSALLYLSYERTGDEATHTEAVVTGRAAVDFAGGGPHKLRALNNLASSLLARTSRTGDSRAVTEAIELLERAISMAPPDSPELVDRLNNLGGALHAKFLHTGDRALIDRAVELGRRAVTAAMASDRPGRFGMLSELGVRLKTRHTRYGDVADIEEAAERGRKILAEMPNTDPDRPGLAAKSIMAIWNLYSATKRSELLTEVIAAARAELRDMPANHHALPELWTALGAGLDSRYFAYGDIPAGREARHVLLKAAKADGLPLNRINRYRLVAGLSRALGDWRAAADALTDAIGLLPMTASRRLSRTDQERQLGQLDGVVQDACACALQAGDPELAVTVLEHGRGILFAQTLENRDDLSELRDQHPDLARPLGDVRDRLTGELDLDDQHAQANLWDRLVTEARGLPGFERFMLPASISELLAAADQGPLVMFSINRIRSDALILTSKGIEVVSLPQATPEAVHKRAQEFITAVHRPPADLDPQTRRHMVDTLTWLWKEITGPVLTRLGIGPAEGENWPHVWWCPTGPLSFLPLHAAGNETDAVMDRAISSYTPTVRALQHARRSGSRVRETRALVVAMSGGVEGLPGAAREADTVAARIPVTQLTETTADRDRVLRELSAHPWVHFACHGQSDPTNPSASHLLLRDHAVAPLTVVDISRLHLEIADLAYLSACSTARVGTTLTDEAIHLASAFQLAGYRHVVATLWPISDRHAVRLAEEVYDMVVAHGTADTARAVHEATRRLRHRRREFPEMWAAHIHTGA